MSQVKLALCFAGVAAILNAGCTGIDRAPQAEIAVPATSSAAPKVEPAVAPTGPPRDTPARVTTVPNEPATAEPIAVAPVATPTPAPPSGVGQDTVVAVSPAAKPATPAARPPTVATPVPKPNVAVPEPATVKAPPLDLKALETRLKATEKIGVFSKLALKNQIDDLLDQFRAYYGGKLKVTLAELRHRYDLLVLKVLALLQDADPPLAQAIAASREAIWGILADPAKFASV